MNRGEVITFKEVEWSTLRLLIDATENESGAKTTTTPIRLITNQGKVGDQKCAFYKETYSGTIPFP